MKILHIVPTYLPAWRYGGTIQSVHGVCKSLVKRGHQVHVYTTNVDGPDDLQVDLKVPVDIDGVKVWYFPSKRLRRIYWSPDMRLKLASSMHNFDLLHLHSIFLWPTWMAARMAEKNKVPYIVSPRGMLVEELIRRKNRLIKMLWIHCIEKRTLKKASAIHMTSELEVSEAKKIGLSLAPVRIVPNGIETETYYSEEAKRSVLADSNFIELNIKRPFILYLGRINWKKGLERLISAMRFVPGVSLVIVGNDEEGYTRILSKLAEEYRVNDRVLFHEPIYSSKKQAFYKAATLFVLPSYSENFGNAVLEAMAAGCPVVVTPEVGLADIIQKTGAGLVVDGNPEVLGRNLQRLMANETLMAQMAEIGARVVRETFSWEIVTREIEEIYGGVIK